jgi:hypothetical protein
MMTRNLLIIFVLLYFGLNIRIEAGERAKRKILPYKLDGSRRRDSFNSLYRMKNPEKESH